MGDYRAMYDRNYLYSFDLKGRDVTVEIARVDAGKLQSPGTTKKTSKPILFFKGREQGPGLACNKTNGKTIAKMFGTDTADWIGKKIVLYPTTTKFGSEVVDCIRVRPQAAKGPAEVPSSTIEEPPGEDVDDSGEGGADGR